MQLPAHHMDATEALCHFVGRALVPRKAKRIVELASQGSPKTRRRIVQSLAHEFEPFVQPSAIRELDFKQIARMPCYAFSDHADFGQVFCSVQLARDFLSLYDGWLLVTQDASAGLFRPEIRWDDEMLIIPKQPRPSK